MLYPELFTGFLRNENVWHMALTAFWTNAPPWEEKDIPKGTASNGYEAKFEYSY